MSGKIEVITGPMFSGKTTELLRRLERYMLANKSWIFIKPDLAIWKLMAIADSVTKLTAVCYCGKDAAFTKKFIPGNNLIDIGNSEKYIACRGDCYAAEKEKIVC